MRQGTKAAGSRRAHILDRCGLAAVMAALFVAGGLIGQYAQPRFARPTTPPSVEAAQAPVSEPVPATPEAVADAARLPDGAPAPVADTPAPAITAGAAPPPSVAAVAAVDGMANVAVPPAASPDPVVPGPRLVPLPVQRPAEFRLSRSAEAPRARRRVAALPAPAQPVPQKEDERSFVEKLFGIDLSSKADKPPALAYASLETNGAADRSFRERLSALPRTASPPPAVLPPMIGTGVAVYDIRAQVVTLPNGEKLEAHSGLGDIMDNPAHVHIPMRGPTPIGTYDLTERERLFHGVRALRLNPVGGSDAVHGRVGLLAHTFMLGPKGASNGCVSFRNYDRFLQAYLSGEVRKLVVVAGG